MYMYDCGQEYNIILDVVYINVYAGIVRYFVLLDTYFDESGPPRMSHKYIIYNNYIIMW